MDIQQELDRWAQRVHEARAQLMPAKPSCSMPASASVHDSSLADELGRSFEELQVAEEELRVQTEELAASRWSLEEERRRYRALFEQAPVPYLVTDARGTITDANVAAAVLLGVRADRLCGKPLVVFITMDRRRRFREHLARLTTQDIATDIVLRLRRRGGGTKVVNLSVGAVRDRRGAITELRFLAVDLTERVQRARHARDAVIARHVAEEADRAKSGVIAMVSHELRTPLAAIAGYAELLAIGARGSVTEEQLTDLRRIQQAHTHIMRLVDDLLSFMKLGSGRLRFDIDDVLVRDALEEIALLVRSQAEARGVSFEISAEERALAVRADPERLRQVLLNLIANALKFTPSGGHVTVACKAAADQVAIRVTDDGIGIAADKLGAIFEPFVQLARTRGVPSRGWGLGLSISREMTRAMHGDLVVESREGHGSIFTLWLPQSTRIAAPDGS